MTRSKLKEVVEKGVVSVFFFLWAGFEYFKLLYVRVLIVVFFPGDGQLEHLFNKEAKWD